MTIILDQIHKGLSKQKETEVFRERGRKMKVINVMEINEIISERQKSLQSDEQLYRNREPMAAEVAKWGIELLEGVKNQIQRKSFEATVNQYKSGRNGI